MTVLVCGSRDWTDRALIWRTLDGLFKREGEMLPENGLRLVHGARGHFDKGARILYGADRNAEEWAIVNWVPFEEYPGAAAEEMLEQEHPDLVVAFHADIEQSKDTKDMVARARRAGIEVRIVTGKEEADGPSDNS